MEYFVTMTTHVPAATPDEAVDDVRRREAARARQLAAVGCLVRLWRPPLQPGEWRTLGLFAAADDQQVEEALVSMPLRVWRTDEVTPLAPHPNDPPPERRSPSRAGGEFLTTFALMVPNGIPEATITAMKRKEAARASELGEAGTLLRLWRLPDGPGGQSLTLGLWRAGDVDEIESVLAALPLAAWMKVETTPLSHHPNDPASPPN